MKKYKDKKWDIKQNEKGLIIYVKCNCGIEHDIELDNKCKLVGTGQTVK